MLTKQELEVASLRQLFRGRGRRVVGVMPRAAPSLPSPPYDPEKDALTDIAVLQAEVKAAQRANEQLVESVAADVQSALKEVRNELCPRPLRFFLDVQPPQPVTARCCLADLCACVGLPSLAG